MNTSVQLVAMWLLCSTVHCISVKALQFVPSGHKPQVNLFAWGYVEIYMYVYSKPLSI